MILERISKHGSSSVVSAVGARCRIDTGRSVRAYDEVSMMRANRMLTPSANRSVNSSGRATFDYYLWLDEPTWTQNLFQAAGCV
jgi:hypothetical protein